MYRELETSLRRQMPSVSCAQGQSLISSDNAGHRKITNKFGWASKHPNQNSRLNGAAIFKENSCGLTIHPRGCRLHCSGIAQQAVWP